MIEYRETLHDHYGQLFEVTRIVYREKTAHQDLVIFETPLFGTVLALDGAIQTTTADNAIYHEMFAHVPMLAHGGARRVLVIGGGDGGSLREVLKHPVERAVLVDIDRAVIDLCAEHMAALPDGAFDDPRAQIVIADGARYVAETAERFDVIIVDSTDPPGPSEVLYTESFYCDCRRCLTPGGVLVTMCGTPFLQPELLQQSHARLRSVFADVAFYFATVPSYTGGPLAFGWASDDPALQRLDAAAVAARLPEGLVTSYYTPEIHVASFARSAAITRLLQD